ncbi:MAG: hypothetical protein RJB31_1110, partial [Bacteroidota bacterium]
MLKKISIAVVVFMCSLSFSFAQVQEKPASKYDANELFNPLFYKQYGSQTRSGNGEPGKAYWQNKADYKINAELNDQNNQVTGSVTLTYSNNSPHNLGFLWFQLDQNLFNPSSRGFAKLPVTGRSRYGNAATPFEGGYEIKSVKIIATAGGKTTETVVDPEITDTR